MDAFDYLLSQLREETEAVKESLAAASAKDYGEYQYLCGKVRGLLVAQSKLTDLKERMDSSDE
jgi:hypothetical protein